MLRLTLDKKENRIRIQDTEVKEQHKPALSQFDNMEVYREWIDEADNFGKVSQVDLSGIDFEGFILEIVDSHGNKWSTEILGWVNG